jgi:hypothetical protein
MKVSTNTLESLSDIERVETSGDIRRIGGQLLLALARKEISATDVEAAAKMIAAQALHLKAEVDTHFKAQLLREKGAEIGKLPQLGRMVIGAPQQSH